MADVNPDTPAAKAGIKRGDVIVELFNGKEVADSQSLPAMVAATPVDQEATVTVKRNGETLQLPVKIGELPSQRADNANPIGAVQPARGSGACNCVISIQQIADQLRLPADQGVVVVGVQPGSRAARVWSPPGRYYFGSKPSTCQFRV